MVRLAITAAAFEAIARTPPLGCFDYEPELNANGERSLWVRKCPSLTGIL